MDTISDNDFVSEVAYFQALDELPKYENIKYINLGNEFAKNSRYAPISLGVTLSNAGAMNTNEAKEFVNDLNKAISAAQKFVYNGLFIRTEEDKLDSSTPIKYTLQFPPSPLW